MPEQFHAGRAVSPTGTTNRKRLGLCQACSLAADGGVEELLGFPINVLVYGSVSGLRFNTFQQYRGCLDYKNNKYAISQ